MLALVPLWVAGISFCYYFMLLLHGILGSLSLFSQESSNKMVSASFIWGLLIPAAIVFPLLALDKELKVLNPFPAKFELIFGRTYYFLFLKGWSNLLLIEVTVNIRQYKISKPVQQAGLELKILKLRPLLNSLTTDQ